MKDDQKDQNSINQSQEHRGVPSVESAIIPELKAVPSFTPWRVAHKGLDYTYIEQAGGNFLTVAKVCDVVERDMNARLIAAAPALYEAAKKLNELDWCVGYSLTRENHIVLDAALEAARAALALANTQGTNTLASSGKSSPKR